MPEESALPTLLERAQVPSHFPLFRNAASLAHLAHSRKGPPYIIVGGKAWYEVADIMSWINQNKVRTSEGNEVGVKRPRTISPPTAKKRGRPSKMEQYHRQLRMPAHKES